ncbi:MAG: Hsp70 family protein [Verrucomicrobiales bacterium]
MDLGTTNSLVGAVDAGFPILFADSSGSRITPSVVYYPAEGEAREPLVGSAAMRMRAVEPGRTITSVKRLMGRRNVPAEEAAMFPCPLTPAADGLRLQISDATALSPEDVSATILGRLRAIAEEALEKEITRAVITVPAYFNDAQRSATKRAGELAGLTVERILNEPTAAALAYGLDKLGEHSKVAVYDLGGGTFDISILELSDGVFQVLSTAGDTRLGGDDIDRALASYLLKQANVDEQTAAPEIHAKLLDAAIRAKHALSDADEYTVSVPFLSGSESFECTVTQAQLAALAMPIVDRTRSLCHRAISDSKLELTEIDRVVLVGGSTRMPVVREIAAEIFGQEPDISQNPDEAVALGAVIQGGILSGKTQNVILLDITPLSLGIETFGGLMNIILPRNTTIPAKAGELFTNAVAGQEAMKIRVLQGEREMAKDNWELGQFEIQFESGPKGHARVGVEFSIDANGILTVLGRDTKTHKDEILQIDHAAVDVNDEAVEAMISESIDYAFDDMNERVWTEAKMKSDELLPAVDNALAQVGDLLTSEDIATVRAAAEAVRAALETHDARQLKEANQNLDTATEHMAALLVEKAMEESLKRKGSFDGA